MLNWAEQILRLEPHLLPTTRELIHVISKYFAVHASARCRFFDHEMRALLGASTELLRQAKRELLDRGYLVELPKPGNGRPVYGLRLGTKRNSDDEAA